MDARLQFMVSKLFETFDLEIDVVTNAVMNFQLDLDSFLSKNGQMAIVWLYQVPSVMNGNPNAVAQLYLADFETEELRSKGLCFSKATKKTVTDTSVESDVYIFEIIPQLFQSLQTFITDLYVPLFEQQEFQSQAEDAKHEFLEGASRFACVLEDAASIEGEDVILQQPSSELLSMLGNKLDAKTIFKAAEQKDILNQCQCLLESWCGGVQALLSHNLSNNGAISVSGPKGEITTWKKRMIQLTSTRLFLQGASCRAVLGVCGAGKLVVHTHWKELEQKLADAVTESSESVKYLSTLEKCLEPLYTKPPDQVVGDLAALFNGLTMIHAISRHYRHAANMLHLLQTIAEQLIVLSRVSVANIGKLLDQLNVEIVARLSSCEQLFDSFLGHAGPFLQNTVLLHSDFDITATFADYHLFIRRCRKLKDLLGTVHQFSGLSQHSHIVGLNNIIDKFNNILDDIKKKPYDLLDVHNTEFDRDVLELHVNINDLEAELQAVIDSYFTQSASTEQSLLMLLQLESLLHRDSFRSNLQKKYIVAFQSFNADLEAIRAQYEKHRFRPPIPRNAPPIAGKIMWSRHLLKKIEAPNKRFSQLSDVIEAHRGETSKIKKLYALLSSTLHDYEKSCHELWLKSVEASKAQLQNTLLAEQPVTGKLLVNFDKSIWQLLREGKHMKSLGLHVPESAKMVQVQEGKLKNTLNGLNSLLKDLDRIKLSITPVLEPLLSPHMLDIDEKVRPGLQVLTWTSMNIEGYLHRAQQGILRVDELIKKSRDLFENRIQANLSSIRQTILIDLPKDTTFTFSEFLPIQMCHINRQAEKLIIRNHEVQRACEELLSLVCTWPRENIDCKLSASKCEVFREECSAAIYQAVLSAVKATFNAMKSRLNSKCFGDVYILERPLLRVQLQLCIPNISLHPSLADIQQSINTIANKVLQSTKQLRMWNTDGKCAAYYDLVAKDPDVVKAVLLLTGSIERMKSATNEYLETFSSYEYLWRNDMQQEYKKFIANKATLEDFEAQLQRFLSIEQDIMSVPPVYNIGALSIDIHPLKYSLKSEADSWKALYSKQFHEKGFEDLKAFEQYLKDVTVKLNRKIDDLEDVRAVMDALREVREMEANIDGCIDPIDDTYSMLQRYDIRVPKEEIDIVGDMRYSWRKVRKLSLEVTDKLAQLQTGFRKTLLHEVKTFVTDAVAFQQEWEANGPTVPGLDPMDASDRLRKFQHLFEVRKRKWLSYSSGEELFGLPTTHYPELEKIEEEIVMLDKLYSLYVSAISTIQDFGGYFWVDVIEQIDRMGSQVNVLQNQCNKLPKALCDWPAYKDCKKTIDDFLELLPLFQSLTHQSIKIRHWNELMEITNTQLNLAEDTFKLQHLLDAGLLQYREEVNDLCNAATKEEQIEVKLASVANVWANECFYFANYKTRGPVILKPAETSELMERLEDSQMLLSSMSSNRNSAPFRGEIQEWIHKLSVVSEIIDQWLLVQNMWMYMEAVFSGGDIVKQLPVEAKRFSNIDKNFMKVVQYATDRLTVVDICVGSDLPRSVLPHLLEQLEMCQKSLSAYLETKRSKFPRFYFVSDPTLLEILSLGSDPPLVVPHFQSGLFDSLSNVTFDKADKTKITEMFSREGEKVRFETAVDATGTIEVWLQRLVDGMQGTLKERIKAAAKDVYEQDLEQFIFGHPAQVSLLGLQFMWTSDTQAALYTLKNDKTALTKALKKADAILRDLVQTTLRTDLTKIQRTNLETCITVHLHQKEATEQLVKKKVRDPSDFEWLKQCRFYWRDDKDTVIISICDVDFEYSYEYLGVKERLVITPLTDICYITLSQALGMFLGGAPAGPAGTGKTETTKDLGNTLGKYVVVFNCSDQMDFKGMGKIYKGLAQSGLWGCFDEFNRINLDVLSVCAQQIYCVLSAIRERKKSFIFTDGSTVTLDPRVGYFITMNPGYAGRQELPENLKALFRGVTMMVPNRQIIMKVKLAACGYQENDLLSKKFSVLYGLCEQQLSKQAHYDFGLRNILSVLRTAGSSKRSSPDKSEVSLMMRTLRDMNMSKFVAEDVPLFMSLIDDIFPGQRAERSQFSDITRALEKIIDERGLQKHPTWLNKCVQLYETYLVRHGIMVIGPSGSGKTTMIECLAAALSEIGTKHVVWRMNPKAITAPQMFGRMDSATGDWTDGIFSVLWRRAAKSKSQNTWIVLDGPVDAIWIENLNTVLDDNKVLTLANGDRILMTSAMKAMFEPENLNNASPATVSRAGIIYVSDSELGWQPVVNSWLQLRPDFEACILRSFFDKFVDSVFEFVRLKLKPIMHSESVCQVCTLLTLLSGILDQTTNVGALTGTSHADYLERIFIYCLTWSLGGLLDADDRVLFDAQIRRMSVHAPLQATGDTVFDFVVSEHSGDWQHWSERIPRWEYPKDIGKPKISQLLIPTLDTVRYEYLLSLVHSVGKASMLVGGPGTAKTCTIQQFLSGFDKEKHLSKTITFSYLTSPCIFQRAIEEAVEKRQGRTFGPPGGKSLTVFIDDISMPAINEWGDQVTNEIVRQLLDQGGFYSLEKPIGDMKSIIDTRYLAAMNTPGGGRNDVPNRLKRHFCIFNVPAPSSDCMNAIFGSLMSGHFSNITFSEAVVDVANKLVRLTIDIWNLIQCKLLPTPAKFHYQFNMRDLSRVFQGLLLAETDRFVSKFHPCQGRGYGGTVASAEGYLLGLWIHECQRVFADRLIVEDEKLWVQKAIFDICKQAFPGELVDQVSEPLVFVNFLRESDVDEITGEVVSSCPMCYESVPGGTIEARERAEAFMAKFNEDNKVVKLDLVLFEDALQHLLRILRVLSMDRGSALLVGVGGSGKQSLARLASYISGAYTFQITISKTYNISNLLEDIKGLYRIAGLKGQPVCFIFTDAEVKDDSFLEYINQLLMTGDIAGLFAKEELDAILNDIRPTMKSECPGLADTFDNLYQYFLTRVRDRLHVVMCFSPVGKKFSRWAQQFPGLINGCAVDWFLQWPEEALIEVASKLMDSYEIECAAGVKQSLKRMMASVHLQVTNACQNYLVQHRRQAHVTPKSYLSFIDGFKQLYNNKMDDSRKLAASINSGLQKMFEAKADVNRMKGELAVKNRELAASAKEAESLLHEISESTAVAEKEKQKVAIIVDAVSRKADEIAAVKSDAEHDLAQAKPALDAAIAALNSISPKDITALKALKNPPDVIKRIFDCVLLLRHLSVNKVVWQDVKGSMVIAGTYEEAVKMMGDLNFLQALVNFPKEQINDETLELLQPYFSAPDFNYESAKKASGNVAGLCNWSEAMCKYHEIAKVVEPKIEKLRESEAELKIATKERQQVEDELSIVQSKLYDMQLQFDAAMSQKQALEDDAAMTQKKMEAANHLITALAGEEARWTEQSNIFDDQINRLIGDCAIASSFVSYLGPFNKEFREALLKHNFYNTCTDLGIPVTKNLQAASFLSDESEIGKWNLQGLPTDDLSIQNGILVTRATRYPVLIDPQGQGKAWILNRESEKGLIVTQLNNRSFRNHLEDCISTGKPLLIENIDEDLDPVLDSVLDKRYVKKGKYTFVQLADKDIDVSQEFRLYCTTRLPNPKFSPELFSKVSVIDFTVTATGLEDQLLGKLILREKHDLERQRQRLVEEVQSYKLKIKQLEDDLLFRLSNSKGNLLDDTELIDILAVTKQTAQEVNERLVNASATRLKITEACEEYRPVAHRATLLYFLIAEFSCINSMYQTSLAQFDELYIHAIDQSEKAMIPAKRIQNIIKHMTFEIYMYTQRGLFERHKLIFALMLAIKIQVSSGQVKAEEVDIFLKLADALHPDAVLKKPKEWIPDKVWMNVMALAQLHTFNDLPDSFLRSDSAWRAWYDKEAPEAASIPDFESRITKFQRMCLVRSLREDRTLIAAVEFICDAIGERFVESIPLNMERAWQESCAKSPLICLLSPGADPTKLIEDLAKKKKIKTLGVSMGQGQEFVARKYMAAAATEGHWVLLQNAHLGLGYLQEVETFLSKSELHDNFRLWITAEPHLAFPIGLLQLGIKITNEAPVGIKAGMRASYQWITQDMLDAVNRFEWRQLLFATCFLHSIVQERRKFGPIGFNVPYEFNQSDLSACTHFLQNHISDMEATKTTQPDWSTIRYMVSTIQYGGRITDDYDRILLDTYAEKYYHQEVLLNNYELFRDENCGLHYCIPDSSEIEVFRKCIEELPGTEGPELFGLHSNADIAFRTNQVMDMVQLMLITQPNGIASGSSSREDVVDGICADLLSKLPEEFHGEETKDRLRKLSGGPTMPLTIHLRQEIDRLNKVLILTKETLCNLRLAIAGTIALNDDLLQALDVIYMARVPPKWLKVSWEASSLGKWFAGLIRRHEQLYNWLQNGRPKSFWMTGFSNPQGFLTAVKQEVTRKHASDKWALDDVVLVSEVTKLEAVSLRDVPSEGVYIHGLYLDGCSWGIKEGKLVDSEPKRLYSPLPVLHVTAVMAKDKKSCGYFEAPCYRVKARTAQNFVAKFMLKTDEDKSKWTLRGVALLCSTE